MKLIINADDYGLTKGVSKCIRELLNAGTIRSTTVMINFASEEDLRELAKIKNISVGLHFVLDTGYACNISELTDEHGKFKFKKSELANISKETIRKELESQFNKLSKFITPTHIDSHHHLHLRKQNILEVVQEFALTRGIKYREAANKFTADSIQNGTRGFINEFFDKDLDNFPEALDKYNEFEECEMMCHPGYDDEDLRKVSSYTNLREYEVQKLNELNDIQKEKYEMNKKPIKIVTIGGGSSYTPELAEGFIKRAKELPIKEWALVDVNEGDGPSKLDIIHSLVERMFKAANLNTKITKHLDRREALKDADFVTTQLRVGRLEARAKDERIPLSNGFIGQETNGAGGLFKALRTIPVILDIVKDVKELAPNAWIVNFTNPAGIVTQAVAKYGNYEKFLGVCNVPINTKFGVAKYLGVDHSQIQYNVAGLNHFVYFTDFWLNGKNVKNQVLEAAKDPIEFQKFQPENIKATIFDSNLIKELDAMPCGYHRYYYNKGTILKEYLEHFQTHTTRAEEVMKYEKTLFERYKDPNLSEKPKELEKRGGAHYSEVACAVVNAIYNNTNEEMVVSTINNGHILNFENGVTVESIARISDQGALPVERENKIPTIALEHVHLIKRFELMVAEAAVTKNSELALAALQINPLSEDSLTARKVFNELLDAHAPYLKGFKKV